MNRQTGRTTQQIKNAPNNSIYLWCNNVLDYPKIIANKVGRNDLNIVSPMWLERDDNWRGKKIYGLTLDHATNLTLNQYRCLEAIKSRI